jgi:hypothetical protein
MEGGRPLCGRSNDKFSVCAISAERNTLHKDLVPSLRVTIRSHAPYLRRLCSVYFSRVVWNGDMRGIVDIPGCG